MPALTIGAIGGAAALGGGALSAFSGGDEGGPELAFFPSRNINRYLTSLQKPLTKKHRKLGFEEGTTRGDALVDTDEEFARKFQQSGMRNTIASLYGDEGSEGILSVLGRLGDSSQDLIDEDIARRGETLSAFREGDPVLSALFGQAEEELASGGALDPATRREVQQATRSGQSARGMGFGSGDLHEELMNIGSQAEARRRRQQAFALSLLQSPADFAQYQAGVTPASGLQSAQQLYGLGANTSMSAGPQVMENPFGPAGVAQRPASNPGAAFGAGLLGAGGQLLGAGIGMAGARPPQGNASQNPFASFQVPQSSAPANTYDFGYGLNTYIP